MPTRIKEYARAAGAFALLAMFGAGAYAQEEKPGKESRHSEDVIIIRPRTDADTRLNIEINGPDVKVNGQPLAEFKNDAVEISRHKEMALAQQRQLRLGAWQNQGNSPFRGSANMFSYGPDDNRALLGVGAEKAPEGEGAMIKNVAPESAAQKAGLKQGDIITGINDTRISSPEALVKTIGMHHPDDKITITYKRDKKEHTVTTVLAKRRDQALSFQIKPDMQIRPDMETFHNFNWDDNIGNNFNFKWTGKPRLGLKAQETEDGKGLKVLDVDEESAAEKAGIKEGDIITAVDGTGVNTIEKLCELAGPAIEKGNFTLKITRDGKPQDLTVKIPKKLNSASL